LVHEDEHLARMLMPLGQEEGAEVWIFFDEVGQQSAEGLNSSLGDDPPCASH